MTDIPLQIAAFQEMDKKHLVAKWVELYHQPPPPRFSKELMVPLLAYPSLLRKLFCNAHARPSLPSPVKWSLHMTPSRDGHRGEELRSRKANAVCS